MVPLRFDKFSKSFIQGKFIHLISLMDLLFREIDSSSTRRLIGVFVPKVLESVLILEDQSMFSLETASNRSRDSVLKTGKYLFHSASFNPFLITHLSSTFCLCLLLKIIRIY